MTRVDADILAVGPTWSVAQRQCWNISIAGVRSILLGYCITITIAILHIAGVRSTLYTI